MSFLSLSAYTKKTEKPQKNNELPTPNIAENKLTLIYQYMLNPVAKFHRAS